MKILAENVLLRPESNDRVVNGIIIPETTKRPQRDATVITAGEKTEVKEGDRVIFNPSSATKVVMDGEYYLIKGYKILYIY